jgi:hypothetical protein
MNTPSVVKRLAGIPFIAIALALVGLQLTAGSMDYNLTPYDEGLLVTNGMLIGHGQIPYRDFYSNYPPGSFLLVELCSWLGHGGAMHPMRIAALGIRVAGAAFAAILAGRMTKGRARVATFAAVLLLQSRVSLTMLAYVTAVTLALAAIVALPADRSPTRWRYAASGVLFGLMTWFRHDLAVYMIPTFGALALVARLVGRPVVGPLPREGKKAFAIAFLAAAVPFWLLVLGLGGPSQVLHDLVFDQARYIQPARVLPMPSFSGDAKIGLFDWTVPSPLADYVPLGLLALGGGIVFGALRVLVELRPVGLPATRRLATILALTLAVATAPQALQRTDSFHVGYVAPAALACLFGALGGVPVMSQVLLFASFLPFVASHPGIVAPHAILDFLHPRPDDRYFDSDEKLTAAVIRRITKPEDRIFVGCTSHRRIVIDHVSLYYVAKRLGATRILQFDPGTVTRDDVQETMVKELEAHPPAAVVLTSDCYWDEPNASRNAGSDRLDRYIAEHFVHYEQHGTLDTLKPR